MEGKAKKSVKSDMSENHKIFAHQMFENCHVAAVRCIVMNLIPKTEAKDGTTATVTQT